MADAAVTPQESPPAEGEGVDADAAASGAAEEKAPADKGPSGEAVPEDMTPRTRKRYEKKKARAAAKAKRDADRAKAKAERAAMKEAMKGLDGKARDELRRKMTEDAEKKRKEAQMQRQIDRAAEAALANPRAKVELSAEVIAFQKEETEEERKIEEAEAAEEAALRLRPGSHVRTRKMIVSREPHSDQ